MRVINCQPDSKSLDSLIAEVVSLPAGSDFIEYAGTLLGMSRDSLLRQHTLTPFFNALEGLKPSKPGTKSVKHRQVYDRKAPFRLEGKHPRYCRQCAQDDVSTLTYSYWRRADQLPGKVCCSKHGTPLALVSRPDAFELCPHQITDSFVDGRLNTISAAQAAVLDRYAGIAEEILRLAPAIDSVATSKVLGNCAKAANLRVSREGSRPTVSSQLVKLLPSWWLAETLPRVHWAPDKCVWTIDAACVPGGSRYTTAILSLLAAFFYKDADDAIAKILEPHVSAQERTRGFNFWASKAVFDAYIANGGVVSRVAEQFGLPHSTVALGLLNQGLPGLGKASTTTLAARAYLNGQSQAEACAENPVIIAELDALIHAACSRFKAALDAMPDKKAPFPFETSQEGRRRATG